MSKLSKQVIAIVKKKGLDPVFKHMTLAQLYENGMITKEELKGAEND